ncbi:hypothetical protein [Nannocystis sp. SCPEA4]|uniref:hypothetical protein n=1 Tax=Nannocystis sp. SCPEA4 TaxID=2996787 RepID=UPI00226E8C18|nr:hypothetical protein [Nannocystis sp. SCPEA4]
MPTTAPTEADFLARLGVSPFDARPSDGFWCYRFTSDTGEAVQFSFNMHERSVQTMWLVQERPVCTVVHENAAEIRIVESAGRTSIHVDFLRTANGWKTGLELQISSCRRFTCPVSWCDASELAPANDEYRNTSSDFIDLKRQACSQIPANIVAHRPARPNPRLPLLKRSP